MNEPCLVYALLLTHSFTHASFRTTNSVSFEPPDAAAQLRGEQCQQPQRQQPASALQDARLGGAISRPTKIEKEK